MFRTCNNIVSLKSFYKHQMLLVGRNTIVISMIYEVLKYSSAKLGGRWEMKLDLLRKEDANERCIYIRGLEEDVKDVTLKLVVWLMMSSMSSSRSRP